MQCGSAQEEARDCGENEEAEELGLRCFLSPPQRRRPGVQPLRERFGLAVDGASAPRDTWAERGWTETARVRGHL